ncbi:FHA domain-containing protein, partial [Pseudomonas silesiensis]|uniref:FHA domain-containing protein n=1 Tax=Pseudomonas silesiensis TaxID=1853130 RepID=UPI0034D4C78E
MVHIYPSGPNMGKRHSLGTEPLIIGRADAANVKIVDNSVSRTHARIEPNKEGYYVVDLKSLNGTYVND